MNRYIESKFKKEIFTLIWLKPIYEETYFFFRYTNFNIKWSRSLYFISSFELKNYMKMSEMKNCGKYESSQKKYY